MACGTSTGTLNFMMLSVSSVADAVGGWPTIGTLNFDGFLLPALAACQQPKSTNATIETTKTAIAIHSWGIPDASKLNRLAGITQPVLVANGDNDRMVPTPNSHLLAEHLPGVPITTSAAVLPQMKEYERTSTTVVNTYVRPIVERYLTPLLEASKEITRSLPA